MGHNRHKKRHNVGYKAGFKAGYDKGFHKGYADGINQRFGIDAVALQFHMKRVAIATHSALKRFQDRGLNNDKNE